MGRGGRGRDDAHDAHGRGEVSHQHFCPQLCPSEFSCRRIEASVTAPGKQLAGVKQALMLLLHRGILVTRVLRALGPAATTMVDNPHYAFKNASFHVRSEKFFPAGSRCL